MKRSGALALAIVLGACGKDKLAAPVDDPSPDPGAGVAAHVTSAPVATTDGELQVNVAIAEQVVTLLDGMPAGSPRDRVIGAIGAHCSRIRGCVEPACAKVLDVCQAATLEQCGAFLTEACPGFRRSPGAAADKDSIGPAAAAWIVDRYRPVVKAARGLLTPAARERLDDARARHGL